ncbi:MAG TPA: lysophospholipid acyltransferase family protein [Jatrophihabitantaceae bacterium]|nr:lysophospholipid acyltransferase family protein [Jatrophihabitantaceae bacterium]
MPERPSFQDRINGSQQLQLFQKRSRRLSHALGRVSIEGMHRMPSSGPVVLAVNHRSMLDGPMLFGFIERPVTCLVKSEAFEQRIAPVLWASGQIPVVRDAIDPGPIRYCLDLLAAGGVVGIFPEGARGDGLVHAAKPGVGYFAMRSGAPVVPVALTGTYEMAHRRTLRRPPVRMVVGEPIPIEKYPSGKPLNRRLVAETTERIRVVLAELVAATNAHERAVAGARS